MKRQRLGGGYGIRMRESRDALGYHNPVAAPKYYVK